MGHISYIDGRYVPHRDALVHVEDRGYQFADGVYEVCAVRNRKALDFDGHKARLFRSLNELSIPSPVSARSLQIIIAQMIRRNRLKDGLIYIQVTRGVAPRDHFFPAGVRPTLVMTARPINFAAMERKAARGLSVGIVPDLRWARCDIKSVGLLPNVLAKQAAFDAGADDAWLVDAEGFVTEGASANAWIVTGQGTLVTRSLDAAILGGITRNTVVKVAKGQGVEVEERRFSVDEALSAREAFCTSAAQYVMPVTHIDGKPVAGGEPGALSLRLREAYLSVAMGS